MARPEVSSETERFYSRLPEFYHLADEGQASADGTEEEYFPLLRFISGIGSEMGRLVDLHTRFDYEGNGVTSDLVDPITADNAWIPWLAALAGVQDAGGEADIETASFAQIFAAADTNGDSVTTWDELYDLNDPAAVSVTWQQIQDVNIAQRSQFIGTRAAIYSRLANGHDEGTNGSIERAVKAVLIGEDPYCFVGTVTEANALGLDGVWPVGNASDPWDIYIVVLESEAPPGLVGILGDIVTPVKPAGMRYILAYKAP